MIKKFVVRLNSTLISPHIDTYAYNPKSTPCWITTEKTEKSSFALKDGSMPMDLPVQYEAKSGSGSDPKTTDWTDNQ